MTKAVTVLGTGIMGAGVARSLLRAGFDVTVWNRSADKATPLADDGATVAPDVAAAVSGADVVITMLFDTVAVTEVATAALPAMRRDAVWLQTSTVGLDGVRSLAELAGQHGITFVDAPVLGTRQPAEDGKLIVLAGGPAAARDAVTPVLDAIGARTLWVGEQPGDGHRLKLVANSWVLSVTAATAQAIGLAADLGLDPQLFLDVIAGGPLDSQYAQLKGKAMINGDFTPSFTLSGATKDADLIQTALRAAGTNPELMAAQQRLFDAAQRAGHGDDDMAAVITAIRAG
ncbi:MAG TPA: NAD(P)-dependent oxidoreductase [Pseudonocardiaceae bacterium]|nr:NAD(P)-dependent oxidoreductase [Pseudonocardiaceae bacterium]